MKNLILASVLGIGLMAVPAAQAAPVSFGIGIGVGPAVVAPPICPYGYYPDYPYACAPLGYYGPEWFDGGIFIGAGPWFHGFHGRPGFYGRPGFDGRLGFNGRPGFAGRVGRAPMNVGRVPMMRAQRGGFGRGAAPARGGFRGGVHGGRGR